MTWPFDADRIPPSLYEPRRVAPEASVMLSRYGDDSEETPVQSAVESWVPSVPVVYSDPPAMSTGVYPPVRNRPPTVLPPYCA